MMLGEVVFFVRGSTAIFGPEGFGGMRGGDGEISAMGGAKVAIIARWTMRRTGSYPDGRPKLMFRAWFSWRNDALMAMCAKGVLKGRVRIFMQTPSYGKQQIDIVDWDEWQINDDGMLTLVNITGFDTAPLRAAAQ